MKTDLDLIIEHLEKSKTEIEEDLQFHLHDRGYLEAHYLNMAWQNINDQLLVFLALENKNFRKIQILKTRIEWIKKSLKNDKLPHRFQRHFGNLPELEKELEDLLNEENPKTFDSQVLNELLFDLGRGKIQKLILNLIDKYELSIEVEKIEEDKVGIVLLQVDGVSRDKLAKIKKLGFQVFQDKASLILTSEEFQKTSKILEVLAFVVFDFYQYERLDNPISIKVFE